MDREAKKQYGRRQKKEIEDKKISDAIVVLKNCDDYELRKVYHKQLITQIKGPEYHIHHRIPVKNAGETNFFSEVNLFKNLVLIEKDIYHKLVHMCEKSECVANKRYFSKLLTPNNSALISGLEPQDVIYYDFEKSTKIINKALEDVNLPRQENVVQPSNSKENNSSAQQKNKFNFDKMRHNKKGGRNG